MRVIRADAEGWFKTDAGWTRVTKIDKAQEISSLTFWQFEEVLTDFRKIRRLCDAIWAAKEDRFYGLRLFPIPAAFTSTCRIMARFVSLLLPRWFSTAFLHAWSESADYFCFSNTKDEFDELTKHILPPPSPATRAFRPELEKARPKLHLLHRSS